MKTMMVSIAEMVMINSSRSIRDRDDIQILSKYFGTFSTDLICHK